MATSFGALTLKATQRPPPPPVPLEPLSSPLCQALMLFEQEAQRRVFWFPFLDFFPPFFTEPSPQKRWRPCPCSSRTPPGLDRTLNGASAPLPSPLLGGTFSLIEDFEDLSSPGSFRNTLHLPIPALLGLHRDPGPRWCTGSDERNHLSATSQKADGQQGQNKHILEIRILKAPSGPEALKIHFIRQWEASPVSTPPAGPIASALTQKQSPNAPASS